MIAQEDIYRLCEEGESNHLDFKATVYPFEKATDKQKSELLKDVLAFANARRQVPALILCGVEKNEEGVYQVKGVDPDAIPDDASVQQFVNSKINKELSFSTYSVDCNGKFVWVLEVDITLNDRPYYLKSAYDKLSQYCVPIRQGSSTRFASPDDVYKMATDKMMTEQIADFDIIIHTRPLVRDQVLVAFDFASDIRRDDGVHPYLPPFQPTQYEEYKYLRDWLSYIPIVVGLKNISKVCAEDISVKVSVESADNIVRICDSGPVPPVSTGSASGVLAEVSATRVCRTLCAGDSCEDVERTYMIAEASGEATIVVAVFCKQLNAPVVKRFPIRIALARMEISAGYVKLITCSTKRSARYERFLSCLMSACNEVSQVEYVDWGRVVHEAVHTLFQQEQ